MSKSARPELSVEELSIVLVGDFNPTIFHPAWFAHHELIRQAESDKATVKIIHQDAAEFSLEWISVQVLRDRFTATIKADAYQAHMFDLVVGALKLLSHTPVRQLGMNLSRTARFTSNPDWHAFGHFLAAKSPWRGVLQKPGLRALSVQGERDGDRPGYIVLSVTPSIALPDCTLILVNDHYEMPPRAENSRASGAEWAVETIERCYDDSIKRAAQLGDALINNFCQIESVDDGK